MSAPATIVRPANTISSQHGELRREVQTETGEMVTLIDLPQESESSVEDEELPDPDRPHLFLRPMAELQRQSDAANHRHVAGQLAGPPVARVAVPVAAPTAAPVASTEAVPAAVNNRGTQAQQELHPPPNLGAVRPRVDRVRRPIPNRRRTTAPTPQEK